VATPIGHLGDITLRALETFRKISAIACEDTRVTADLLRLLGLPCPPLLSVREHNERAAAGAVIDRIRAGAAVAYVTDAGTPCISDPGARLVHSVRAAGQRVIPVPGVSAPIALLSVAGLAERPFAFVGFAPRAKAEMRRFAANLTVSTAITVFFESPHRIEATLRLIASELTGSAPERRVVIGRELTKRFEEVHVVPAGELLDWLEQSRDRLRGEFVVAVDGADASPTTIDRAAAEVMAVLLEELPPARAAKVAARLTGVARADLYAIAEAVRQGRGTDG